MTDSETVAPESDDAEDVPQSDDAAGDPPEAAPTGDPEPEGSEDPPAASTPREEPGTDGGRRDRSSPSRNGHDSSGTDDAEPGDTVGIVEARTAALEAAEQLLEHDLEGVVRVESTDDGWRALVEVVERSAVPDTQDIIGRYEVVLDRTGTVTGYGLVERYRRGDTKGEL